MGFIKFFFRLQKPCEGKKLKMFVKQLDAINVVTDTSDRRQYHGAMSTRCIALNPRKITAGVNVKLVRFGGIANVDGRDVDPASRREYML